MIFSVSPEEGQRKVKMYPELDMYNVSQREIAHHGKCRIVQEADEFWGGGESRTYTSKVMVNPTWRKIFNEAKKAQKVTKDFHHDFLECLYEIGQEGDVTIYRLGLGS